MRAVMDELERSGLAWYITGSEALAAYGSPRQTMDVDVVIAASTGQLDVLAESLGSAWYYSEPVRFSNRSMAALIDQQGAGKVDFIVRDLDPWGQSAMERRRGWEHPSFGRVWISSLEDLVLAKLEWSEGTSELQLRDCAALLRMNPSAMDVEYLDRWAAVLGISQILQRAREDAHAS